MVPCDNPATAVFATPDLIFLTVNHLVDVHSLPTFLPLSLVSKQFREILRSDQLWRDLCHQRWKGKWGFHPRWNKALREFKEWKRTGVSPTNSRTIDGRFWRWKYLAEEQDSTRQSIFPHELKELVFDFRFWIGQPNVVDGRIVVQSGLLESASREVRFVGVSEQESNEWWTAQGELTGHPLQNEERIQWFLDERTGVIQWGFVPNLWPKGIIRRLNSWGWEIMNPNVVLRAINPSIFSLYERDEMSAGNSSDQEIQDDEIGLQNDQHILCDCHEAQLDVNCYLWKDLIDDIQHVPLINAPMVNGYPVTAEIPRIFMERFRMALL